MENKKVAAYAGTRNLYESMIPAIKSIIMNSNVDKIYLLIEDNEFPYEIPEDIVECINVSEQKFFRMDGPNMKSQFTYMAMMRATYCKLFPELDKILSLDVDTIVVDDISDIWDLRLGTSPRAYYFAAAREPARSHNGTVYTNIGVALYNLKYLRESKGPAIIDLLNSRRLPFVEQDAFNMKCQGKILLMDSKYNATKFTDPTDEPKIIHFAGQKEWQNEPLYKEYMDIPWNTVLEKHKQIIKKHSPQPIEEPAEKDRYLGDNWKVKIKRLFHKVK